MPELKLKPYRTIPDICRGLKAWHRRHGPLVVYKIQKTDPALHRAFTKKIGSIEQAARRAGVPYRRRRDNKWTRASIKRAIKDRRRRGKPLNAGVVIKGDQTLYCVAVREFGTWGNAVTACGLDYTKIRLKNRDRTPEDVINDLKTWSRKHGIVSHAKLARDDYNLAYATLQRFGTFEQAARAAGVPFRVLHKNNKWSCPLIIRQIRSRRRRGKPLSASGVLKDYPTLYGGARLKFGSWAKALRTSGIDPSGVRRNKKRTPENILKGLKVWSRRHGIVTPSKLQRDDLALFLAAQRYFGSLKKAARKANLTFRSHHP